MTRPFDTVWVIGLGAVGSSIALLLAERGYRVVGIEPDPAALTAGNARIHMRASKAGEQNLVPRSRTMATLAQIEYTVRPESARPAHLVIEAVPEQFDLKAEVLRKADSLCGPDTVFVTTTTGLSVTALAARTNRMTRVVGMQLCDPGRLDSSELVEIAPTPVTDGAALERLNAFVRSLDRTPVTVPDLPGFVGNALLLRHLNRAVAMCEQGYASRDDIDTAMRLGCAMPLGPLAHLDLIGLDNVHNSLTAMAERTGDPALAPAPLLTQMVGAGLLGRKSGRGFYRYNSGETDPVPVPPAPARPVGRIGGVGIVGSGTMATGIAQLLATSGYRTVLVARSDIRAKEALVAVERALDRQVQRGRLSSGELGITMDRLVAGTDMNALADCDLIIESVSEDVTVKRAVFAELDRVARPGATLATTTSSLPVLTCATATSRPERVIGLHFFNPAPVMALVEVVRTFVTDEDAIATARTFTSALGKHPVVVGDRAGFIVNALLLPYLNDAARIAREHHLDLATIDHVMSDAYGYPLGPFTLLDVIGLDVSLAIQETLHEQNRDPALAPARYLRELAAGGFLGRKTGRGFHGYPACP